VTDVVTPHPEAEPVRTWQDETRPLPERVELLLAAMTLEEKVGQLGSRWVGNNLAGEPGVEGTDLQVAPMQEVFGKYKDILRRVPDLRKAERLLGYRPKHTLEEAIRKTLEAISQSAARRV